MKQIIIMRHGKPLLEKIGWITPAEMERWIELYNRSEVVIDQVAAFNFDQVRSARCIVASTARRALSSLQALGYTQLVTDAVFCEAQLPFALWRFPRLPPLAWAAFFRILWFFGYARGAESIQEAKIRAHSAAHKLSSLAEQGPVLFMGHGIINRLIAKELTALGWVGSAKQKSEYWGVNSYKYSGVSQMVQNRTDIESC
jgi:broad specificity phosphatase PhoE